MGSFFRFGARAAGLQSSVMILRILRDLQAWSPHWKSLKNFALELIVEKSLASVGLPLSPGDALRRVFEAISGKSQIMTLNKGIFVSKKLNIELPINP